MREEASFPRPLSPCACACLGCTCFQGRSQDFSGGVSYKQAITPGEAWLKPDLLAGIMFGGLLYIYYIYNRTRKKIAIGGYKCGTIAMPSPGVYAVGAVGGFI